MKARSIEIVERERAIFSKIAFINISKKYIRINNNILKCKLLYSKEKINFILLYDDLSFL